MKNLVKCISLVLSLLLLSSYTFNHQNSSEPLSNYEKITQIQQLNRFAFGSCNKEFLENSLWDKIASEEPQLFMWGGDNIYGDRGDNAGNLKEKYEIQNENYAYKNLKKHTPIIGIWDDHDFGINDAGSENPNKENNKHLLLDFLEVPINASVRYRDGVYQSYALGHNSRKVKFIMLDNRYNLTEDSVLGEKQWQWLEQELRQSTASIHFIVGGISIIGPKIPNSQQWANYPQEQKRLISLLKKHNTPGVVFLTGDKHFSGVSQKFGYVEVMSSGMTHTKKGALVRAYMKTKYKKTFFKKNYALVDIDWDTSPIKLYIKFQGNKKSKLFYLELANGQFVLR